MPKRISVITYQSPEVQGDDSWVKMMRPTVQQMKDARAAVELAEGTTEAVANEANMESGIKLLQGMIVEWNWVTEHEDEHGNPIPLPQVKDSPNIVNDLTDFELKFLLEKLAEGAEKTPAQKKSSKNSRSRYSPKTRKESPGSTRS